MTSGRGQRFSQTAQGLGAVSGLGREQLVLPRGLFVLGPVGQLGQTVDGLGVRVQQADLGVQHGISS